MPNGIDLLMADHEIVNQLFAEYDATPNGIIVGRIVDALKAHDEAEHAALYPMCTQLLDEADLIASCEAAHSTVKAQIELVVGLEGTSLTTAVQRLRELVEAHVKDEEQQLFPALTQATTAVQLEELGTRLMQAKQRGG